MVYAQFVHGERHAATEYDHIAYRNDLGSLSLVGSCLVAPSELEALASEALRSNDLDGLRALPGGYSIILNRRDDCTIQTDPSGRFPIFWRNEGRTTCLSTDTRVLGQEPNLAFLGSTILRCPELTYGQTAITDVHKIEGGCTAYFQKGQPPRIDDTNVASDPSLGIDEAAYNLRRALTAAVEQRLALGKVVTSDCSGGFDSTTLALLATKRSLGGLDGFVQYTQANSGDARFARAIANDTPNLRLHEIIEDASALPYSGLGRSLPYDQPDLTVILRGRLYQKFAAAKASGSELHLSGDSGDAVLDGPTEVLADLARLGLKKQLEEACLGYSRARARDVSHVLLRAQASALRTLPDDLRDVARLLRAPETAPTDNLFHWIQWPQDAVTFLAAPTRRLLSEAAEKQAAERRLPEAMSMGDYVSLSGLRGLSQAQDYLLLLAKRMYSIDLHLPYTDRQVTAACLQLPGYIRSQPGKFKLLLRQAFPDVIPEILKNRVTKGGYGQVAYKGLRAALPAVRGLFGKDSRLGHYGVLDLGMVQAEISKLDMGMAGADANLNAMIAAEIWLRQRE